MKNPKKSTSRRSLLDHITSPAADPESQPLNHKLPGPPPAPRVDFVTRTFRMTNENDLALERAAYWIPGKTKQQLFNDALHSYLQQFPESKKPIPTEYPT